MRKVEQFISEDDLQTFEGWLRYQCIDPKTTSTEELESWHQLFEDVRTRSAANPKVGLMCLRQIAGEHRYAVAVREGADLWLVLWVRRSRKGEYFVFLPRGERDWDTHTSYHLDGTLHMKSHGRTVLRAQKVQPLTGVFRGTQPLTAYSGYGPKNVGAICDPTAFSGVVEIAPKTLGPRDGVVTVDVIEPDVEPPNFPWTNIIKRAVFQDVNPWVVITVGFIS